MEKKILTTPISAEDLEGIKAGDIVYLTGLITTCRDVAHRRLIEYGRELPVDVRNGAILHAGPIVKTIDEANGKYEMISVGPTTSMRMEKFEYDFVKHTGVRLIVGKGGMGPGTQKATEGEEIEQANWKELGMPETLWTCRVKEFGPLIVSIDTYGNNWFEQKKVEYNESKEKALEEIYKHVSFIK